MAAEHALSASRTAALSACREITDVLSRKRCTLFGFVVVGDTQWERSLLSAIAWDPIYKVSYDNLMIITIMPKLRSTYDGRLIYTTSYEGRKAFLRHDSLAKL